MMQFQLTDFRNKSFGLFMRFNHLVPAQAFKIFGEGGTTTMINQALEQNQPVRRMAGERISSDRIGDGLYRTRSNYIAIGDLSPKSDGTFDGAPRIKPSI